MMINIFQTNKAVNRKLRELEQQGCFKIKYHGNLRNIADIPMEKQTPLIRSTITSPG
jgi:fructose-1,6-bisphosphatase